MCKAAKEMRRLLLREGFGRAYANRAADELREHWRDLVEEGTRQGLNQSEASTRADDLLGSGRELAVDLARRMQSTSWLARHQTLSFGLLPVVLAIVWWAITFGTMASLPVSIIGDRTGSPSVPFLQGCADWTTVVGLVALPMFLCHVAVRFFCGWRAALWGCLVLAIHNSLNFFQIAGQAPHASMSWGYHFNTGRAPNIWLMAAPIAVFFAFWWWNSRKENNETEMV